MSKHLGGADTAKFALPDLDVHEAKTTSACYQEARALMLTQSLFDASMWVPGDRTQHFTSAKRSEIPIHPYTSACSRFTNRQQLHVSRMALDSKRDRFGEVSASHVDLSVDSLILSVCPLRDLNTP